MAILSISLNDHLIREIGKLQKELGFSGRSEIIRAGIRMLIADKKEKSKLRGTIDGVLLVIHDDDHSETVSHIRHRNHGIIKTQVHNHLENHKCLDIFVVKGEATAVRSLVDEFQTSKKMDVVKLMVS